MMALNNHGVDMFTAGQDLAVVIECFRSALFTMQQHLGTLASKKTHPLAAVTHFQNMVKNGEGPQRTIHRSSKIGQGNSSAQGNDCESECPRRTGVLVPLATAGVPGADTTRAPDTMYPDQLLPSNHGLSSPEPASLWSRLQESTLYITTRLVKLAPAASTTPDDGRIKISRSCLATLVTSFNQALTYQLMSYTASAEKAPKLRRSALRLYELSLTVRQKFGDPCDEKQGSSAFVALVEISIINNMAVLYHQLGFNARALSYFERLHAKLPELRQLVVGDRTQLWRSTSMNFVGNLVMMFGPSGGWKAVPAAAA